MIVAIDGPSGAGKSTVAKAAAKRLGFSCLDTGAMYRAIAWKALADGVSFDDADALAFEIDHLIESLGAYSRALKDRDQRYLENLLAEGDRIKRALDDEASH